MSFHDRYLNPPLIHSDACKGCIECAKVKIFSTSELLREYPCDYREKRFKCTRMATVVKDIGLDADDEQRLDICFCDEHKIDDIAKWSYRENIGSHFIPFWHSL